MYVLLILAAAVVLFPLIYAVGQSLTSPADQGTYPPKLISWPFYIQSYSDALKLAPIGRFVLNSFVIASAVTVGQLVTASLAAFAFSFLEFRGRNILFYVFLSTMMIPAEATLVPNYLTVRALGWLDSYPGFVVPFIATAFGTFLLRQFFLQLPKDLYDAAKIDGASPFRFYWQVVLPLSRPALATLGVYSFLHAYNMYLWPLLITNSETMRTVQIGIKMLMWDEALSWNLIMAGVTLVILPSILLLILGQKQLIRGLTAGALKG
ncbi:MAG: carbohydrate ABC transporter permease [Symbiobacteriia bacterium]